MTLLSFQLRYAAVFAAAFLLAACADKGPITPPDRATGPIRVDSVVPARSAPGSVVTIYGGGFGKGDTAHVYFGDARANATVLDSNRATAMVPADAISGPIGLAVGDSAVVRGGWFSVKLSITSFTPAIGGRGDSITLFGTGFAGPERPTVTCGERVCMVFETAVDHLGFLVPDSATDNPITVTLRDDRVATTEPFRVLRGYTTAAVTCTNLSGTLIHTSTTPAGSITDTSVLIGGPALEVINQNNRSIRLGTTMKLGWTVYSGPKTEQAKAEFTIDTARKILTSARFTFQSSYYVGGGSDNSHSSGSSGITVEVRDVPYDILADGSISAEISGSALNGTFVAAASGSNDSNRSPSGGGTFGTSNGTQYGLPFTDSSRIRITVR